MRAIGLYFLLSFREWVGVKMEVLDFGAIVYVLQGFEALSLKKRFTEKLKLMCDNGLEVG